MTKAEILATPEIKKYFDLLNEKMQQKLEIAQKARQKGFDASTEVECLPAADLAERTENIVGIIQGNERQQAENNIQNI